MANKKSFKFPIKSDGLYAMIKFKTSIRALGPAIGYSEKTIRRGLEDEEMTPALVMAIADGLDVDWKSFVDVKKMKDWEMQMVSNFTKMEL